MGKGNNSQKNDKKNKKPKQDKTKTVVKKRRNLGMFAVCLPMIATFLTMGAFGEMVGYLAGSGTSLDRVE